MKRFGMREFHLGWIVGDFEPSLIKNSEVEVSVKRYRKGEIEPEHYQLLATEITVVISGTARLGTETFGPDDIAVIPPGEAAAFEALEDVVLVAIKSPSLPSDKVLGRP